MNEQQESTLKVVVVDDCDFSRDAIVEILESEGIEVLGSAGTAEKAIELFGTTSANLFIIDVVMPGIGGLDIAKFINEKEREIFIIMISSLNTESVIIKSITTGISDFIHKPFDRNILLKSVRKIEAHLKESA